MPRVLIVAEHASFKFGGEAALPLHYFRLLRRRGAQVWLVCHARTRDELEDYFPGDPNIVLIDDTPFVIALYKLGQRLPHRLAVFTTGFVMRLCTQLAQRRIAKRLIADHAIQVVHQPMPVSPKEPSMVFGLSVPVVIGPMNGGMTFPSGFGHMDNVFTKATTKFGRWIAGALNYVMPGKPRAAALLVANSRTQAALPVKAKNVYTIVENGVDLGVWKETSAPGSHASGHTRFIFVGRLVDWKAVDLLLAAFKSACKSTPMSLTIVGDGNDREKLEQLADELGLKSDTQAEGKVFFSGWVSQARCAELISNSDALVLPSVYECGGAVVLEAMALGRPVIATNWGGPADYLDETCGVLVEPTNKDAFVAGLSQALIGLAQSPELREEMGRAGQRKIRDEFDWEKKLDRVIGVYWDCIRRS